MSQGERPRALCILGMHRSGTSAVTRAFNLLGAFVGDTEDLMRASPENPEGHWERNDLYRFHERLLFAVRRRWDTGRLLPKGWQSSPELAPYREELKSIVSTAFAGRSFWAWKDPRTCILLELWKEILEELRIDLAVVVVVRHPCDVAASLGRRDGFGPEKSLGIWTAHLLAALGSIEGVRSAFISYDEFLEDPAGNVRRCVATLGLPEPDGAAGAYAAIGASVRKELRHSQTSAADLAAVPAPVRELHQLVRRVLADPRACDGAIFGRVRELRSTHDAYAGFFREDHERCLETAARLSGSESRCREHQASAVAAVQQAAAAEQRAAEAEWCAVVAGERAAEAERCAAVAGERATEAERCAAVAGERAAEAERCAAVAGERARLSDRQRIEVERALLAIAGSRIWRATKPLRRVADLVRAKAHPRDPLEQ